MVGGLMQLSAYGAQDIYLTGNPQITFFKVVYRRHTNFAIEAFEQQYNGGSDFGKKITIDISRHGDLLSRIWLEIFHYDNNGDPADSKIDNAFMLIDYAEIRIGGQTIDKQYGEWMVIWTSLTNNLDKGFMLNEMIFNRKVSQIPLQFWFCLNPGLALPLIALQYHDIKLIIQLRDKNTIKWDLVSNYFDGNTQPNIKLVVWCDYIFLDIDERRRFSETTTHEYLIEQIQYSQDIHSSVGSNQHTLRFSHPVKEVVWVLENINEWGGIEIARDAVIQVNGQDRFKRRIGEYFTNAQRYQHHSGCGYNLWSGNQTLSGLSHHIYSFGLKPEEHQPSGTCNFSKIDNVVINYYQNGTSNTFRMWAINYNVLRIISGMASLAYAN
jgi:hypothetical protein